MDKLEQYRKSIMQLITDYGHIASAADKDIEVQIIIDKENDHYQIINIGWQNDIRIYGCSIHIDIKDDKIWIQHNGTERRIAQELTSMGVSKDDIVLAFHVPYRRQFTGYATN